MKDKVVVITGSSSGIGRETAFQFASLGAKVVIHGRNENAVKEVAEKCKELSPYEYQPLEVVLDLNEKDSVEILVETVISNHEKIDILVNNAGFGTLTPIEDSTIMNSFDTMMNIDVRCPLQMIHHFLPYLIKSKGCIINVSSFVGLKPMKEWTVYCMAKAAIDMMTKCLALEIGPQGVRINCVNPALIKTNFFTRAGLNDDAYEQLQKIHASLYPLKRVGEPIDIAKAIIFLASEDASFITGAQLNIDGGALYSISG